MVKPWNTKGVEGVYRFLGRVWRLFVDDKSDTDFEQTLSTASAPTAELLDGIRLNAKIQDTSPTPAQLKALHTAIKKVTEDLENLGFNTAISALMIFINEAMTWDTLPKTVLVDFLKLLQPLAPHLAEEMHLKLTGSQTPLTYQPWPQYDPALLVESTLELPVQINGKLRDVIKVPAAAPAAEIEEIALASDKVKAALEGKAVKKIIVVPKRIVNIAVS
jgi:leucyl-tRNA synthetase